MGWFKGFSKKQTAAKGFQNQKSSQVLQLQTFILEPILTPSGIIDTDDHSHDPVLDVDAPTLPKVHLADNHQTDATDTSHATSIQTHPISEVDINSHPLTDPTNPDILATHIVEGSISDQDLEHISFFDPKDTTTHSETVADTTDIHPTTVNETHDTDIVHSTDNTVVQVSDATSDDVSHPLHQETSATEKLLITDAASGRSDTEVLDGTVTHDRTSTEVAIASPTSEHSITDTQLHSTDTPSHPLEQHTESPDTTNTHSTTDNVTEKLPPTTAVDNTHSTTDNATENLPQTTDIPPIASSNRTDFSSGVFTVGETGEVGIDFLFDGGGYKGELAIFSLKDMEHFTPGSTDFIKEAATRALSNSEFGHVVISDPIEGARFSGNLPGDGNQNSGAYLGVKTFQMRAGDEFGVMLVPNGTLQQLFNNPNAGGALRPLFSLVTANPNEHLHIGQIADVTGEGNTFVMEDLRVDTGSDRDYNDIIFQVRGATGKAVHLNDVINPVRDWRTSDMGQALIAYAEPYVTPDVTENIDFGDSEIIENPGDNTIVSPHGSGDLNDDIKPPSPEKPIVFEKISHEPTNTESEPVAIPISIDPEKVTQNTTIDNTNNSKNVTETVTKLPAIDKAIDNSNNSTNVTETVVKVPTIDNSNNSTNVTETVVKVPAIDNTNNSTTVTETVVKVPAIDNTNNSTTVTETGVKVPAIDNTNHSTTVTETGVKVPAIDNTNHSNTVTETVTKVPAIDNTNNSTTVTETVVKVPAIDNTNHSNTATETVVKVPAIDNTNNSTTVTETVVKVPAFDNTTHSPTVTETVVKVPAIDNTNNSTTVTETVVKVPPIDNTNNSTTVTETVVKVPPIDNTNNSTTVTETVVKVPAIDNTNNSTTVTETVVKVPPIDNTNNSTTVTETVVKVPPIDNTNNSNTVTETVVKVPAIDNTNHSTNVTETVVKVPTTETAPPVQQPPVKATVPKPPTTFDFPKANQPLVGVIDTGFSGNNIDIDYSQIKLGHDNIGNDANPLNQPNEGNDPGTEALGIIAAKRNNGIGIDGINDKAPIWVGRAEVNSDEWAQSLIEFVDAAKASKQPNAVVNLSFNLTNQDGTHRFELTGTERAALAYAQRNNVLIVASAGDNPGQISALGKAGLEFDNIITVGAAERVNNSVALSKAYAHADYSGSGAGLDIVADGGSAKNPITVTSGEGTDKEFGTSVATAKVTGAVSQVWAANSKLNFTQVIDILKRTATDLGKPNWDADTGAGLLNMAAAVTLAKVTTPEPYTVKPGQETITDNFISQNNRDKQLPGDPAHPAVTPPGIPRTNIDQGANDLSGTRIRISATEDVIDQVSSIDPIDVYRGASRELAGAKFKVLTGQAVVSILSPSGQVLSQQVLSRGTHNLQMPANAPAEVLLKITPNGGDATYVLQGFEAERNEPFDINLEFESPLTASQQQIMQAAARSVASLIGKGLPSAVVDGKIIDDVNIKVSTANLDGASGTQARTKIDFMRYGTLLPAQSITQFDAADVAELERSGELFSVAQHEFLHALGFGNLWEAKGLVDYAGTPLAQYNGKQAVDAFKDLGGLTDAISLETEGKGSAGLHWNEMLFQDEVMTYDLGFKQGSDGQVFSPISAVTIASLADLGYQVNLNRATPDFGLFGGGRFNPDELTPEQIEAFRQLAEESLANQSGEFIPAIMPEVDPNKVAPEIWAHAERGPNGEYYDWEDYLIVWGDTLSELAEWRMGSGSPDNYWWIANHNGIPDPDYIQAGEWIQLPVHRPNYEWEQEQERLRREDELRQRQEQEARERQEQEDRLRNDQAEQERLRQDEERLRQEAEANQRVLEEQARRLAEEQERRRREREEYEREQVRLAELRRQAEIARQQGKGGLDWYLAKPLPEFGPVDPFETSLTGETVGNLVPDDYYRFTLSRGGRITADLIKLLADADLVLYDARNEPIAYSMREGITDEQIIADLIPGTYMLRVNSPKGVTTDYDLVVKFKHKLSQMEIGPPPGWRVGGNSNGGGSGGGNTSPGVTFADPRIQKIFNQALAEFSTPLRKTLNQQVADLKSKREEIEREQKALIASMSAELRQKVHASLDKVRDDKRRDIDTIANGIKGDIDWLVDGIWNNIKNLIPGAVRDFGPIKSGLDGIWQAIDGSKKWLQGKIDWVKDRIQDAIWWFIQKLKDAYITGGEANIKVEEFAKEFRNKIDEQVRNLNGLIDDFRSLVLSKVNFTKSIGVDWPWVGIKFNLYDAISGKVNELTNGGKGLIEKVGGLFKDRTNDVEYLVQQAIGAIASLMGDETGRVYNKMRADMQEIDNQINSLTGQTENTIRAKASQYKFDLEQMLINLGGEGKKILDIILDFGNSPVGQLGILAIEILLGFVPGIGQAIDIKDTYVALDNIYVKGQKNVWEYINLLLALSGWVPGLGDLIKSVGKAALKGGGALVGLLAKLGADTVESIIKAIRNTDWNKIAKNLFDTLGNKWDDIAGKITDAPSWLLGKLRQGFDNVRKGVTQTIDNFKKSPVGQWLNEAVENLVEQINKVKTAARLRNELGERLFNDLTSDLTLPGLELLVNNLTSQGVKNLNNNLLSNSGMTIKQAATAFQRRAVGTPSLPSNLHGYGNANMSHFLDEHTFEFLDFAKVRPSGPQSMWPPGTDVAQMLEEALRLAPHPTVAPGSPIQRTLSNGITVQIGSRLRSGSVEIGQFFPISGSGVVTFNKTETDTLMDIKNLLGI